MKKNLLISLLFIGCNFFNFCTSKAIAAEASPAIILEKILKLDLSTLEDEKKFNIAKGLEENVEVFLAFYEVELYRELTKLLVALKTSLPKIDSADFRTLLLDVVEKSKLLNKINRITGNILRILSISLDGRQKYTIYVIKHLDALINAAQDLIKKAEEKGILINKYETEDNIKALKRFKIEITDILNKAENSIDPRFNNKLSGKELERILNSQGPEKRTNLDISEVIDGLKRLDMLGFIRKQNPMINAFIEEVLKFEQDIESESGESTPVTEKDSGGSIKVEEPTQKSIQKTLPSNHLKEAIEARRRLLTKHDVESESDDDYSDTEG
ncbi:MAG: hypothetical protein K2Q34_07740 [Alphaproteobacteria bacterium]|nr:hypothetical protein [Alphaproteobacteria bacterium]